MKPYGVKRTHCPVPGHGTHCSVARGIDADLPRSTVSKIALALELDAEEEES
jgi:hypothetical protein